MKTDNHNLCGFGTPYVAILYKNICACFARKINIYAQTILDINYMGFYAFTARVLTTSNVK